MIRVQSFDRFDVVGGFDPRSGAVASFRSVSCPSEIGSLPLRGHFTCVDGLLVVVYRSDQGLQLHLDGASTSLEDVEVEVAPKDGRAVLTIRRSSGADVVLPYQPGPSIGPPLEDDPTPFVDPEDWDFGLWLTNVVADAPRQARMYCS